MLCFNSEKEDLEEFVCFKYQIKWGKWNHKVFLRGSETSKCSDTQPFNKSLPLREIKSH